MASKPRLPDGYELPAEVNGWRHTPESSRNGHVWSNDAEQVSVSVFQSVGTVRFCVSDDRVDGFANKIEPYREPIPDDIPRGDYPEQVATGIEEAVAWMQEHAPADWEHPEVTDAVFDAPAGYVLDCYDLGDRTTEVYYRREDAAPTTRLAGAGSPDEYTIESCPYLYIHVWNGSGDATVALAPWRGAHGPGSRHLEVEPVLEPPEDCGLDVAVMLAREWIAEQRGLDVEPPAAGQASLEGWSA